MGAVTSVDADGIHASRPLSGAGDVFFGGRRVWSFQARHQRDVPWPKLMHRFLDGWADVRVAVDDNVEFQSRVSFGQATDEIAMVDRHGLPVMVDKWGLIQRPFEDRDPSVIEAIVDASEQVLAVLRDRCGLEGWISFGTLLGAARSGKVIGHDSDVDLCYLSEKATPAKMTQELWAIGRALRDEGFRVVHKNGSFLTVQMTTDDGASNGIDVYTCFFLDGLLYESATVRAPMQRSAIFPLAELEFEGRMLPVPADTPAILEASYGKNWQVPDPSFKHQPGPEIVRRFDQWFGSLWRGRRAWRQHNAAVLQARPKESGFAHWVADRIDLDVRVVDIGAGSGLDLAWFAERGHPTLGLDYAFPGRRQKGTVRDTLNLYDLRDALTRGALLARTGSPKVICARNLLEALDAQATANFWTLVSMALRPGGELFLEGTTRTRESGAAWTDEHGGGPLRVVRAADVRAAAEQAGAEIVELVPRVATPDGGTMDDGEVWRMACHWPVTVRGRITP